MKRKNYFAPSEEIYEHLSFKEQRKIVNLISCDLIFTILFMIFTVVLLATKHILSGVLVLPVSILFIISLILLKKGKIHTASLLSTIGTTFACVIVTFFTDRIDSSIVHYRTACFCITMGILNAMAAIKIYQIHILHIASLILIILSQFTTYLPELSKDPMGWISALMINVLAILAANLVLFKTNKNNDEIVEYAENEQKQIVADMDKITTVLHETKESLDIGNKLNDTSTKATESVNKINSLYQNVLEAAEILTDQTENAKVYSSSINTESEKIGSRIHEQTNALSETSAAITEISSNLSSINTIAERRREKMGDVADTLESQSLLLDKLVRQVEQVKVSSNEIAKFVETVDSIAGQTNLLAMNASIEAAHAGTMGKGFGVIAQEIRKLSEQTAKNASKISETLKDNAVFVQQTTESVTEFALENKTSADEIKETINGIEEILRGIGEMNKATRDVMISLQTIVENANENSANLKIVVDKIDEQNENFVAISGSTTTLQNCMASLSDMITAINVVIFEMRESAKQNDEVAHKITELLK